LEFYIPLDVWAWNQN